MVDGIGGSGAGRAGIEAALKRMQARVEELGTQPQGASSETSTQDANGFSEALRSGLEAVEGQVQQTNDMPVSVLEGRLDLHEVAAQLKETEMTFQFALQVRNKLIDAYREVMRMSL